MPSVPPALLLLAPLAPLAAAPAPPAPGWFAPTPVCAVPPEPVDDSESLEQALTTSARSRLDGKQMRGMEDL
ncbi:MAG: hypothetical protein ABI895_15780 [Deltaproteobacteria bacterium]